MNIIVTGSTGFVGRALVDAIRQRSEFMLTALSRKKSDEDDFRVCFPHDLSESIYWTRFLLEKEVLVHTAGLAHIDSNELVDPLSEFRRVNVDGTLSLARQAAQAGVRRFIFISSIGVNGNISSYPFTEKDSPNPIAPSAQAKWEAERGLWKIQRETGLELVIIRPTLVYGPDAPGNFGELMRWVRSGVPFPLGAVHNQRSLVALDNLVDLIVTCIAHPAAANQVFLAGDGQDISTTDLLRGVARSMGKPSRLIPVPASVLMLGATLLGKQAEAQRLLGSLQVDISKARQLLGWSPPLSVEEGLRRCFQSGIK